MHDFLNTQNRGKEIFIPISYKNDNVLHLKKKDFEYL